jgi:hypothetical protein
MKWQQTGKFENKQKNGFFSSVVFHKVMVVSFTKRWDSSLELLV